MAPLWRSPPRFRGQFKHAVLGLSLALLAGCTTGDFGRVRPSLTTDGMHSWIAADYVGSITGTNSRFELTDDERQLRDLAYPLIEPPFDRNRWYAVLGEYGVARVFRPGWWRFNRTDYSRELMKKSFRSASGRYAQLIEDIRDDLTRIGPFFALARRVADMDRKREQSLAYISKLTEEEQGNALKRISENRLVVNWVYRSLIERAAGFRYALERLVIADPSPQAVNAERAWTQLQARIEAHRMALPDLDPVQAQLD
jgi:hypothetical protein